MRRFGLALLILASCGSEDGCSVTRFGFGFGPTVKRRVVVSSVPPVPQLGPSTEDDGNHIVSNGQSLSIGADGDPALTTTQPFDGVRASGSTFPALVETTDESHVSAMINHLRNAAGAAREWIGSTHGGSGTALDPGHLPDGTQYENVITQVGLSNTNRASLTDGNYRVVGGVFIHGESDVISDTDPDTYLAGLETMRLGYESEIQGITGQTIPIPWVAWQTSSAQRQTTVNSLDSVERSLIPHTQWRAALNRPNRWFVAGPKYFYSHPDGTHLDNTGYRLMGEYTGMIWDAILINGISWKPLSPDTITASGSNIRVCYHVPCDQMGTCDTAHLVLDTTPVACPEVSTGDATCRYGYELIDPNPNPRYITAVAVDGNTNCVDITTDSDVQTGSYLAYAWTGKNPAFAGPGTSIADEFGSARGNLRDTNTVTGFHSGTTLRNWAIHHGPVVITGGTPPAASVAHLIEDHRWTWAWDARDCPAAGQAWTSASFAEDPQNLPYGAGTWSCNASTHASLASTSIGSARANEALDSTDGGPGCWRTANTGSAIWDVAANEDIWFRYVGVIGRHTALIDLTSFFGDVASENTWNIRVNMDGSMVYTFSTGGTNISKTVAGLVPASPVWAVVDLLIEKQGGHYLNSCKATLCVNGTCDTQTAASPCGATQTGDLSIGCNPAGSRQNPYPALFYGYAIGEAARNGWRVTTDDFAGEPWRMRAIDTEHDDFCSDGLAQCAL